MKGMVVGMKEGGFREALNSKKFLVLISVILSFLFWFLVVSSVTPETTKKFKNVTVQLTNDNINLTKLGLQAFDTDHSAVSVQVSGPRYLIGRLSAKDIVVTPQAASVKGQGSYTLALSARLAQPNPQLLITRVEPASVSVYYDRSASRYLPVTVEIKGGNAAQGYLLQAAASSPGSVQVTGPELEIAALTKAAAAVSIGNNADDTVTQSTDIVLYVGTKQADTSHLTLDKKQAQVTVPILKLKQVTMKLTYTDIPAGFDMKNLASVFTPAQITVMGRKDVIDSLSDEVMLGTIKVSTLNLKNTFKYNVLLPNGISSKDGVNTATAALSLSNTGVTTLSTRNIATANTPSGYMVTVRTRTLRGITLLGPAADIGNVSDVLATANLASITSEGDFEVPVTISVPGKTGYWSNGNYKVSVRVTKS